MQKTSLQIDNKEINLKDFFTTLKAQNDSVSTIQISVSDYSELGGLIYSLIGVCQTALNSFNENQDLTEIQKQEQLGCSSLDISNVLGIAKNLLPISEFQLLSSMSENIEKAG